MGLPELAEQLQNALGNGHVAVAIALAAADVQEHAFGVDVGDGELEAFAQAQPATIDGGKAPR